MCAAGPTASGPTLATFEAELLYSEASDIVISIDLNEPVLVLPRKDGSGYDVQHPPEPNESDDFGDGGATFTEVLASATLCSRIRHRDGQSSRS